MTVDGTKEALKELNEAFLNSYATNGGDVDPSEYLALARRYPKSAAMSGSVATYIIGYQAKLDQKISAKDPMKAGIGLMLSKPYSFENQRQLSAAFEVALTQKVYEREAKLVAVIPFVNADMQVHLDNGLTRHDFTLLSQVAVWSAGFIAKNVARDIAAIGRFMNQR